VIENIHQASHANRDRTDRFVAFQDKRKIRIHGHSNWYADGHRQLHCECGHATFARNVERTKKGISVRVEGTCDGPDGTGGCGYICITAGRWRLANNKKKFVLARSGEERDWAFGNFFTYHDPLAKDFGDPRHSCQEGFLGSQMTKRFNALEKRWIRRKAQAEIDIAISLCMLNAASIRARRAQAPTVDPPLALAA
jgi:hypothetical protein